jgi:hypothetical protein
MVKTDAFKVDEAEQAQEWRYFAPGDRAIEGAVRAD